MLNGIIEMAIGLMIAGIMLKLFVSHLERKEKEEKEQKVPSQKKISTL